MPTEQMDVLLVEDDGVLADGILVALRAKGLATDYAADTTEAMRMLARKDYRVVVVDIVLPDGTGFDIIAAVPREGAAPPRVVVITGADSSALGKMDRSIVKTVLFKPFDPEHLAAYVHLLSLRVHS